MGKLADLLRFDHNEEEFELLETEQGEPGFFGGYPEEKKAKAAKPPPPASSSLKINESRLKADFYAEINTDVLFRRFLLGGRIEALVVCINGMASGQQINDFILRQGMRPGCMDGAKDELALYAIEHVFAQQEAKLSGDWGEIKTAILQGQSIVMIEGENQAVIMDTRGFEHRGVGTAENEKVVRGPQESFNESIRTNVTLLRRIIQTEDFVCEFQKAGAKNNISLVVAYRAGIVNQSLLDEVKKRLSKVDTRMIIGEGTIEQLTERHSIFPLPQVLCTERPDRTAAHIMQGHVAVLVEGSPAANVMPVTLFTLMSTSEDAYMRRPLGMILRVVRYLGAIISILLPGYFLATCLHHPGMLSTEVLTTIIASRQMVFLPFGAEVLFLLWVFQLLREAGIRVPGSAGQAIGIIGGLILGQAAVSANMVSTVVLIVVALSGLGTFTIPDYSTQISAGYFRLGLVFAAWLSGLLGFALGVLIIGGWIASQKSYGVPFLAPVSPKTYTDRPGILRGRVTSHSRATDYTNTREDV
ncbi:spore germination protein [Eubacteriales bacterium OttesenSCG-928-K08]|nr:spore germination protein [Eubacteriales bacterium OttesenSCG-928-K08]